MYAMKNHIIVEVSLLTQNTKDLEKVVGEIKANELFWVIVLNQFIEKAGFDDNEHSI